MYSGVSINKNSALEMPLIPNTTQFSIFSNIDITPNITPIIFLW